MPVILIDPCKDERWDAFVEAHPFGWVCHLSAWKRVLESSFPHMRGHYLALVDENGRIQAGLPLFEVRSRLLGNRLVSIPFATLCDPLVKDKSQLRLLLDHAVFLARRLEISKIELKAYAGGSLVDDERLQRYHVFRNHYLSLDRSLQDILSSFHPSAVRQVIKKASRLSLEKKSANELGDIKRFYSLYVSTRKRLGLPPQPYSYFHSLWQFLGPSGHVEFLSAVKKGESAGAIMLFKYKDRVSWEAVGVKDRYRPLGVSHFLVWESIQQAFDEGRAVFDFGRTAIDNQGLVTFKSRWGTQEVDLPQFFLYNGSRPPRPALSGEPTRKLRWFCARLPSPLFVALGKACYRHMG